MEPNQNIIRTPGANTPTPNNLPNIENVPEPPKENLMATGAKEKKGSKGMLIGLILCLLLAAGGVGFGVWAMMDGNTTRDNLNAQISSLRSQNSELLDQLSDTTSGDTIVNIDNNSDVDTENYIYVGEWGMKIKIPESLNMVSYASKWTNDNYAGLGEHINLVISGVNSYEGSLPDFANMYKNTSGLLAATRVPSGTEMPLASPPSFIFSEGGYDYYYFNPQAVYSYEDEGLINQEVESTQLIRDMLSNPDNWSAI